ncbi:MAG: glycoside hydrolase family 2 [Oscillospiraceae bacterium]|nr:glycoside hydrolase family 2 [Oscillospiraceae bacterium]
MVDLMTKEGAALLESGAQPWNIYPRPQMRRGNWVNLNGMWDFTVTQWEHLPESYDRTIRVPFCTESALSGIGAHFPEDSGLTYRKRVSLPAGFNRGRVLLHIGAADQISAVYVNRIFLGGTGGGYQASCYDITEALADENEIIIQVRDDLTKTDLPYGKQTLKRGGMWYTPVSGIWQSVWLESVPETYIEKLNIENRGASVIISVEPALDGTVSVKDLGEFSLKNGSVTITPEKPHFWSPEDPYLYDFTLTAGADRIESYFAIRTLEIKKVGKYQRLCLNGKPYFFHGLLDQGYWPEGLLTPPSPQSYIDDILNMKKLGFNMLRKHIKVEMEEFYYQCDRLGMIVFQDMVNNGEYSYIRDTVLPTISLTYQKRGDRSLHRDELTQEMFLLGMEAMVKQLRNHPCICCWTIFNEGWGQFDADRVYEQFRALDDTRFIDTTSGWFRRKKTDLDSRHVYFRKVNLKAGDKPLFLSEFGGYSYKVAGHSFNPDETYGYGKFTEREPFVKAFTSLYMDQVVPNVRKGLCAAVYTQVSDVEDETNGLVTYDRAVEKLTPEEMLPIAQALKDAMEKSGCKTAGFAVK